MERLQGYAERQIVYGSAFVLAAQRMERDVRSQDSVMNAHARDCVYASQSPEEKWGGLAVSENGRGAQENVWMVDYEKSESDCARTVGGFPGNENVRGHGSDRGLREHRASARAPKNGNRFHANGNVPTMDEHTSMQRRSK